MTESKTRQSRLSTDRVTDKKNLRMLGRVLEKAPDTKRVTFNSAA